MTGLPGSSIADLADRVLGIALQRPAVDAIYQQTDGSPLFVIELLKVLQKEGATRAELIEPAGAGADGYRFTHALIREVLYDELPALERLKLHGRVGDALVDINRADLMPVLSGIAHHYYEAAPLGYSEQAVIFGLRAAERATQMCACEDAIAHYDRVLATLSLQAHESDVLWTAVPSRSLAGATLASHRHGLDGERLGPDDAVFRWERGKGSLQQGNVMGLRSIGRRSRGPAS